jgi:uncharacterized membrane protein
MPFSDTFAVMRIETTVDVDAPADVLWMVLMDVECWPELTTSMTNVRKLAPGPLQVGSQVSIKQPKLPRTTWTVTERVEDSMFVWRAESPVVTTVAGHEIYDATENTARLRLVVDQGGPLGGLVGKLAAGLTRKYVELEAAGLKRKAESLA